MIIRVGFRVAFNMRGSIKLAITTHDYVYDPFKSYSLVQVSLEEMLNLIKVNSKP